MNLWACKNRPIGSSMTSVALRQTADRLPARANPAPRG
jgi:hypothetical protein